jgi:hypothetical protein
MGVMAENAVAVAERSQAESIGRGGLTGDGTPASPGYRDGDETLWQEAHDEALGRGAGPNVARFYADQTVLYLRAERGDVEIAGRRDFQAYR